MSASRDGAEFVVVTPLDGSYTHSNEVSQHCQSSQATRHAMVEQFKDGGISSCST